MIRITMLFKNGVEKVHNIPTEEVINEMDDGSKAEAVDEFAKLFSEMDTLRFSDNVGQRFHIDTKEVVYANIEINEQED